MVLNPGLLGQVSVLNVLARYVMVFLAPESFNRSDELEYEGGSPLQHGQRRSNTLQHGY